MTIYGVQGGTPRFLLARLLAHGKELYTLPEIARDPRGKPYFPDRPDLHFNWSHSGDLLLCALSDRPVGVDIERTRPRRPYLPRYALTDAEFEEFEFLGGGWSAFYTVWTRREAWVKYTGDGLLAHRGEDPPVSGLFLRSYGGKGWRAAVCGEEEPPDQIFWLEKEDPSCG